jgi:hypothetical protein
MRQLLSFLKQNLSSISLCNVALAWCTAGLSLEGTLHKAVFCRRNLQGKMPKTK